MRRVPLIIIAVVSIALSSSSCSSNGKRAQRWDVRAVELENAMTEATNFVAARLNRVVDRPPVIGYVRGSIVKTPDGHHRGIPYLMRDGKMMAGYVSSLVIVVPEGYRHGTLVHECIHIVLLYNRIHSDSDAHPAALNSSRYFWPFVNV